MTHPDWVKATLGAWDWDTDGPPDAVVEDMAADNSTARLNRRHRLALRIMLALVEQKRGKTRRLNSEVTEAHAERKRLRRELNETREALARAERQLARRSGRPGCGKVPIRAITEAWQFVDLVCSKTGERPDEYEVDPCHECPSWGGMAQPYHIGHVVPRAQREAGGFIVPLADLLPPDALALLGNDAGVSRET
jgi:hypothetical protein